MKIITYLQAGDSAVWVDNSPISIGDVIYTSTGYGLLYVLRGPSALDLTATEISTGWRTNITTIQSASLTPGPYRWAAYLTATGERITAGFGDLTIAPNLQTLPAGQSALSFYEQALADTEAAMAAYASANGRPIEWQIGQNSYKFNALPDIQALAAYWRSCIAFENGPQLLAQGQGNPRKSYVRWGSA